MSEEVAIGGIGEGDWGRVCLSSLLSICPTWMGEAGGEFQEARGCEVLVGVGGQPRVRPDCVH